MNEPGLDFQRQIKLLVKSDYKKNFSKSMFPEPSIRNQAFNKWFECGKFNLDDLNWIGGQLNLVPSLSFGNKGKKEGEKEAKKVFKIALGTRSVGGLLSGDFITE